MALKDQLQVHFSLEEASGARIDDVAGVSLSDNNTVTQATGIVGNGALFTAANFESLSVASTASVVFGNESFHGVAWVKLTSKVGTSMALIHKGTASAALLEYRLDWVNTDLFRFSIGNGTTITSVSATTFGTPALATFYFLEFWYDAALDQVGICVNRGTANTAAQSTGLLAGSTIFRLGANGGSTSLQNLDGALDQVGIWRRLLTTAESNTLYNSGAGLAYSQFSGTYTLSGTATAGAASGSGGGLVNTAPVYHLSGSTTAAAATGSGTGLAVTAPVYHLSGTALASAATGSGTGLLFLAGVSTLSGSATAQSATGSGAGLTWGFPLITTSGAWATIAREGTWA